MNDLLKAVALEKCELTLESYHFEEFLTIPLPIFRKFTDYWINFKRLRLVDKKDNFPNRIAKLQILKSNTKSYIADKSFIIYCIYFGMAFDAT